MRIRNFVKHYFLLSFLLGLGGVLFSFVAKSSQFHSVDLAISRAFQSFQPNWLVSFNRFVSLFEFGVVFIVLPLFVYFRTQKKYDEAKLILIAGLSWFFMRLLKTMFNISCPTSGEVKVLYTFHNLSESLHKAVGSVRYFDTKVCYPSGHVFDYIAVWGIIFFLRKEISDNKYVQRFVATLSVFLIVFVGGSRISLGAHWFSDVVGGYLLGFSWLLLMIFVYRTAQGRHTSFQASWHLI